MESQTKSEFSFYFQAPILEWLLLCQFVPGNPGIPLFRVLENTWFVCGAALIGDVSRQLLFQSKQWVAFYILSYYDTN